VAGDVAAQDGEGVFKVYLASADGASAVAKDFTQAELEDLAKANTSDAKYVFMGKGKLTVCVSPAQKYVTIEQLAAAAGIELDDDDLINATEAVADNPANSFVGPAISYKDMKEGQFFPGYTVKTTSLADPEATPGIVALEWGDASTTGDETAASMVADAKSASIKGSIRNFWGYTVDAAADGLAGKPFVKNANELYIAKPFKVYTSTGNGAKTLVKSYTAAQLNSLATTAEEAKDAKAFLFNKSGWQLGVTTTYIPLDTLMKDAGITFKDGMIVKATASDGFSSNLSYDQIVNGKYFYPAATTSALSADGQEEVGTVLALNWGTVEATPTAGEAKMAAAADPSKLVQQTRIFTGLRSINDDQTGGNRFATGPVELTVVTQKDVNDLSISGVEASYTYTGSAIEPAVTVKDGDITLTAYDPEKPKKGGDFKVSYESNTAIGEGSIIIEGMNGYTGKKTIKFKITGIDISKATVAVAKATYTGKLLKPAVTVKLGSSTLKAGTDYKVTYSYNKNASKVARVTVTGIGIYANSISKTFTIAKAANNFTVKAAKATQKVAYNKKKNVKLAAKNVFKITKNTSNGKVTYQLTSAKNAKGKSAMSKFTVSSAGKVTVKKGTAKGVYTLKVKVSSKAMANYKAASTTVTFKVKVA